MPLWRTQLGSGKVSSSNSSRNSRTSSSSSSRDKTKQGKTRQDKAIQLTYFRRYSGDTLKWKKRTPRHQSPSSFQHNHISKFQSDKTQCDQIPHGTETIGKFQTCKNAGKSINNQNHVFQTQAGRSTHRLPQFFPPTCERIDFPSGEYVFLFSGNGCNHQKRSVATTYKYQAPSLCRICAITTTNNERKRPKALNSRRMMEK